VNLVSPCPPFEVNLSVRTTAAVRHVEYPCHHGRGTVLYDDGINIRTTGLFHSNVGYDSPFTPIPA